MKKSLFFTVCLMTLGVGLIHAQTKPGAYVDENGILRWADDNREVCEFGVHYALPFSTAYRSFSELNLSHDKGIEDDVYHIARLGLNAYRIHVWDSEISDTLGNVVENDHLRLLDYTLKQMKDRGFKMVLTPLNFYGTWEKEYGFGQKYGKRNSFTSEAVKATEKYLFQFMNHVNRYTGIAYKEDPDIIAFELYNEPGHPGHTDAEATRYVNRLVKAVRRSGCNKPLFYCVSVAPLLRKALLEADIQGGSSQWYPVSHSAGFEFKGNLLTHVDRWPKDSITDDVKAKNKALMAYEIDAADNGYSYTYPMMARVLRSTGFQFASMFSYDPLGIGYANVEYRTHFMNMAYTPQKALGLMIAGEVFHRIPLGTQFGLFPADTMFDVFNLSHSQNLAEMVSQEKFLYTNTTTTMPPQSARLKKIAGYGSSPVVRYNGRGIYFLDKLENGIWRLEVMPDATWVDNPFGSPSLDKEMAAIVWNTWPMTIYLPDLGSEYRMIGINQGNLKEQTAMDKQISVYPGTYLLVRKGIESKWLPDDKWGNITLKEFVAPSATTNTYMLHQPVEETTKGKPCTIDIEVISAREPDNVWLSVYTYAPGRSRPIAFEKTSRYGYSASIPGELLEKEDMLDYQISVDTDGKYRTYPENATGYFINFSNTRMYTLRIVEQKAPVCLLDVENDRGHMRRSHRQYRYIFHQSLLPHKSGLELGTDNLIYTSFYFKDKIAGRLTDVATKKHLTLRGYALNDQPVNTWVTLQLNNGLEYGTNIVLSKGQLKYEIPLDQFEQIRIIGPGEKGQVFVEPFAGEGRQAFEFQEAETIKFIVLPRGNTGQFPARVVVEYAMLE